MPAALLALALLAAQPIGGNTPWGDEKSELTSTKEFAPSKALCRKLGEPEPPERDRPTPAQSRALKGCDAEKLYYGQGVKPDYARARQCAMTQVEAGQDDEVFGGSTILMQVYANGLGVAKNLDLATAYACQIDGAPYELKGRIEHLQSLKAKPSSKRFDYCDDITSGLAGGFCQARESAGEKVGRDARLKTLAARLPPAARPLYAPMKAAFDAFVTVHGGGEVDQSGTARAQFVIEEEDKTRDQFVRELDRLLSGKWPAATGADAAAADAAMNAAYRKALAFTASKDNYSTTKPDDVRGAQRAWLAFRDAYLRFAAAASPGVTREAVLTRLTRLRTAQLDENASG